MSTVSNTYDTLKQWWVPAVIGVLLIVTGIYLFTVPRDSYLTLAGIFAASFLVSGCLEIYFSLANRRSLSGWGWYLVGGILSVLIGLFLIANPGVSATVLPYYAGFGLLFSSFQSLGFAIDSYSRGGRWGSLALVSLLCILFSALLLAYPSFTAVSLAVLTAFAFVFAGIAHIVLAADLKSAKTTVGHLQHKHSIAV